MRPTNDPEARSPRKPPGRSLAGPSAPDIPDNPNGAGAVASAALGDQLLEARGDAEPCGGFGHRRVVREPRGVERVVVCEQGSPLLARRPAARRMRVREQSPHARCEAPCGLAL